MTAADLKKLLVEFVAALGLNLAVEVSQDEAVFLVNLVGADSRWLDGGRVQRTHAVMYLVKLMAKKQFGHEPKIVLDFNGERARRIANVVAMAKKKAERVRVTGEEEEMPPMAPGERRAVHKELDAIAGVKTVSRGEEPHRRIVILPED